MRWISARAWVFSAIVMVMGCGGLSAQEADSAPRSDSRRQVSTTPVGSPVRPQRSAKPYFIEFRARNAMSYGHTFAVHGRVGQKLTEKDVAGLHPATNSTVPWLLGHVVMVPSETGASDGDIEDQYILARYRVPLTHAEYQELAAFIRNLQASSPVWHAVFYNCNAFVADIAKHMGLKTPSSTLLYPKEFITELRRLNARRC